MPLTHQNGAFIMAENNCHFTDVKESKVSVSVNTLPANQGTMFIETKTQTPHYKSSNQFKEKSTTFEIKSVVQSNRQDDGEESTDEYDETCSDIIDNSQNNSIESRTLNDGDINNSVKRNPPINNSVENGIDYNNSKNLDTLFQEKLNFDISYNNSHEIYEPLNIQKTDTNTQLSLLANKPLDQWQTRFKVVKIGSAEPFKRGRWSCMDYVDTTSVCQETKQDIATEINSTIETSFAIENSINTNQNVQDILSQTSVNIESNGILSSCELTATSPPLRPPTPQLETPAVFSAPTSVTQQTTSSQVEAGDATDNGYSSPQISQSSVGGFPANIPNGFLVPPDPSSQDSSTSSRKSPQVLKKAYPSFQALLEPLNMASSEEGESAGAGITGALDNKIEQAMDLVKSHLMFAVREEVDVLKDKISELMERIHQLEYENGVLRSHATPEVLCQLATSLPATTAAS